LNDLIIKKKSENSYTFSLNLGSTRWNFSIKNEENTLISGVWVRVGGCGSCPIKGDNQQALWKAVLDKLIGEYERTIQIKGGAQK
jgi:hypothetical protein